MEFRYDGGGLGKGATVGTIEKVIIDCQPANLTAADLERQQVAERAAAIKLQ